jgi:hypothetical protein
MTNRKQAGSPGTPSTNVPIYNRLPSSSMGSGVSLRKKVETDLQFIQSEAEKLRGRKISAEEVGGLYTGILNSMPRELIDFAYQKYGEDLLKWPGVSIMNGIVRAGRHRDADTWIEKLPQIGSAVLRVLDETLDQKNPQKRCLKWQTENRQKSRCC